VEDRARDPTSARGAGDQPGQTTVIHRTPAGVPRRLRRRGATANCRGSSLPTKTALPHLERSGAAHVLTLSPPRNLDPVWTGRHLGHTIVTYGMNLVTLELAYGPADADLMTDVLDG